MDIPLRGIELGRQFAAALDACDYVLAAEFLADNCHYERPGRGIAYWSAAPFATPIVKATYVRAAISIPSFIAVRRRWMRPAASGLTFFDELEAETRSTLSAVLKLCTLMRTKRFDRIVLAGNCRRARSIERVLRGPTESNRIEDHLAMATPLEKIRNIGIIAHIDAGKTTVTERMLFVSGAKHRAGEVDMGTTTTDDDPEEAERGITIYSACVQFPWKDVVINLIDTPGHVDFTAEVERSLRVLDGGVVVFSAREGVEAQSETVWRQANKYHVPRLAFINKMDREGADFEAVFEEIGSRLAARPVALQIPVGQGPAHTANPFRGVIDLVRMKLLTFPEGKEGRKVVVADMPADMADEAQLWRERMLESLYDYSNELMELALAEEPIPEPLIHKVLREATVHLQIQPVLCGSALHGAGVQPILDAVAAYLPNPAEVPPVEGIDLAHKGQRQRQGGGGWRAKDHSPQAGSEPSRFAGWCSRCSRTRRATWPGCGFIRASWSPTRACSIRRATRRKTSPSCGGFTRRRRTSSSTERRRATSSA